MYTVARERFTPADKWWPVTPTSLRAPVPEFPNQKMFLHVRGCAVRILVGFRSHPGVWLNASGLKSYFGTRSGRPDYLHM